ncbi:type II toxin-antitoxin system VapC family toxin [Phaeobacter inhibens]|uniref:type II toxin-antitoxin system VapC family toxin n=1 Tax=Phaeobacter inhibens TaxID=221822 RepID=UPI0021A75F64|nr:type II toxin-antitoxin system VapC family toxin [Phaeobacter inhibens]UWS08265.1 type II toxin-antitoxin system VapC family toxin [Phaeobacter inhibens]
MTAFLDTNIVIALLSPEDHFHAWAVQSVTSHKADGPVIVSDIVYCEASVAMNSREEMDEAIARLGLERTGCSDEALFRAGKAFKKYRDENKGQKLGVLPDFIIGAIADTEGIPLLTTNAKDFTGYL